MALYGAASFALLQSVDLLVPLLGLSDSVTRAMAVLLVVGAPVAILLEWAFELTPDGVRRTVPAAPGELTDILAAPASQRWPYGLFALAGMTALMAGVWFAGRQSVSLAQADPPSGSPPSLAVLPFLNMSSDPEQEYFADGISEELLGLLALIPGLRVASRTSVFSLKGQELEISDIAQRLNVAHVLEGSVRKVGNDVRITVQLVDAASDTNLWSETWERTLEDIFAVQDEIAAKVAERLEITLMGVAPRARRTDPEVYALFLQGRQLGRQRTADGFQRSIEVLERALAIQPDYAPAWGELARVYSTQAGSGDRSFDEAFGLARDAAQRALDSDSSYAPAISYLGLVAMAHDGDLAAAAGYYERALALSPTDTEIIGDAATLLQSLGRLDEAIALKEYVVARDPVNPRAHHNLANAYRWAGRWSESIASYRTALDLSPGYIGAQTGISQALLGTGHPASALAATMLESSRPWRLIGSAMAYSALGRQAESDTALSELTQGWEREAAYNIAYVTSFRGEIDEAFAWLAKASEYNDPGLSEIVVENSFARLRADPRWLPFLQDIGKAPAQLADIQFRVTHPGAR